MTTVGLKTLKNKLSEYIRLAAGGETIIVTSRGAAVAELGPPRQALENWRERGIREGWFTPAKRPFAPLPPGQPVPGLTLEKLLADLDESRADPWC